MIGRLRSRGIEATVGTNAIPFTHYYASRYGIAEQDLPHTAEVVGAPMTLPLYPQMTEGEQDSGRQRRRRDRAGGGAVTSPIGTTFPTTPTTRTRGSSANPTSARDVGSAPSP